MRSFLGSREQQFMHKYVMENGGISKLTWAPLITTPNIVHNWHVDHSTLDISLGGSKALRGFSQLSIRVLEQAMMDKYSPSMNPNAGQVIFFNFSLSVEELKEPLSTVKSYKAFDSSMTKVLAQSNSYNSLGPLVGLSNVSVRNNMDWHLGVNMVIDNQEIHGYLREDGAPLRTVPLHTQLAPKLTKEIVDLRSRTLYDLVPGKLHAVEVDSLKDFGLYDNERHLWTSLKVTVLLTLTPQVILNFTLIIE
uniref:Uncharacterized protein n=1 Tax=Microbotryum cf. violaceum BFL-2013 TaxID=1288119 RepID=M1GMH5_9BASI|nr:hypothetical protein H888_mgp04 [Microbotryum cf. violaceum BFL-2013]AGE14654.1 hypothetical protein [Microbotryum cf. violaceum BFL-2013]